MDVNAYLRRIGYSGPLVSSPDTLRNLQRAHLFTVPFENLDIGWGRRIKIDPDAFVRKIVERQRGGFCYELNGAFAALLEALGFRVTLLSARAPAADGSDGPEFDHLALRVDLDEPWLADVGFGDLFPDPLRLQVGLVQEQNGRRFRIREFGNNLSLEKCDSDETWKTEYLFTLRPRRIEEFAGMCDYHQTSPDSPFTRKRVCSRATSDGRITLSDRKLITTRNGTREERLLNSEEEWRSALEENFGVRR
jgi:N-hydroxyarylamine O-acetyltransferase